jgi:hypothetical protein
VYLIFDLYAFYQRLRRFAGLTIPFSFLKLPDRHLKISHMLACHIATLESSFAMADDSMEISSDHGHNIGDGDIDIDFDFTSAQVDEDYVLEDATLNADFRDNFHPQPSPAIGNDDLMIDGDVDSYQMDDTDLLHDEDGQIMENEVLPFATEDPLHFAEVQIDGTQFGADESNGAVDYTSRYQESSEAHVFDNDATAGYSADGPYPEDVQSAELAAPEAEKLSTDLAQHDSRTASPFQGSPQSAVSAQVPRSPPASNPEHGSVSPGHTSDHPETKLMSPSVAGDSGKVVETTSLDVTSILPPPRDVMVVYQSVEYALFSSSELDDPDSFFLSDLSIAEKPLAELFAAIRQVIEEDLSDEEELCMAVEDLGIETEEVSCTQSLLAHSRLTLTQRSSALVHDVTLTQILNLREKLLRNDGVESLRPLYIILGTRTNFSKRFENLTAGAAEGKGLSQFVTWDEHSESLDNLDEAEESKNHVESTLESQEVDAGPGLQENDDEAAHDIENNAPEEPVPEHEQESKPEPTEGAQLTPIESVLASDDGSAQEFTAADFKPSSPEDAKQNVNSSHEVYDEDDLIDYSEEEGDNIPAAQRHIKSHPTDENRTHHGTFNFFPPCLKPNACFCTKCTILLLAEYEAINEGIRRRSLSQTTEDRPSEQINEEECAAAEEYHEGIYDEGNGLEYEERHEQQAEYNNGYLNAVHEDFTTGDADASSHLEQYNDAGLLADEFGGEGEFTDEGVIDASFADFGTEAQEYNYGDEGALECDGGDHQSSQRDETSTGSIQEPKSRNNIAEADATEDSLEQAETAESSVTVGGDEIQYEDGPDEEVFDNPKFLPESQALNDETEHAATVEHEDEIDYDDDEDEAGKEKDLGATTPLPAAPVMPTSNGKRSRTDAEFDDAKSMRSKGMSWPFMSKR